MFDHVDVAPEHGVKPYVYLESTPIYKHTWGYPCNLVAKFVQKPLPAIQNNPTLIQAHP